MEVVMHCWLGANYSRNVHCYKIIECNNYTNNEVILYKP